MTKRITSMLVFCDIYRFLKSLYYLLNRLVVNSIGLIQNLQNQRIYFLNI